MRARFIALVAAVGFAAAGCASSTTGTASQPSAPASPSPTSTQTQTQTQTQAAPPTTTVTKVVPPTVTTSVVTPAPAAQDPASVVSAFYAAINAQDYATAWNLGGDNLGSSYAAFAAGFAGTAHDNLTITGVQGNTVNVHLAALQTDGTTKVYDGFYVVNNGQIIEGRLTQTAG